MERRKLIGLVSGAQKGDGKATISDKEQLAFAAEEIIAFINKE